MAGNDDLHPYFKNIVEILTNIRGDIQNVNKEIKKIPEILERGFKQVRDAIHENIQAQAELEMLEHMAEVSTVKPQIEAEQEQIREIQGDLDDRLSKISERYETKHAELDEKAAERVRDLGSHIFAIEEDQFEEGVEDPFTTQISPVWGELRAHNAQVHEERQSRVVEKKDTTVDKIESFLGRKEDLVSQIDDYLIESDVVRTEIPDQTKIQIPYYVVTVEFNSKTKQVVVPPSKLSTSRAESWSSVELTDLSGTRKLTDEDRDLNENTAKREQLSQEEILSTLEDTSNDTTSKTSYFDATTKKLLSFLDQFNGGSKLEPSYSDAAKDTLPEDLEITIEGGRD